MLHHKGGWLVVVLVMSTGFGLSACSSASPLSAARSASPTPLSSAPATATAGLPARPTSSVLTYINATFEISLQYPAQWKLDVNYGSDRHDGPSGYFQPDASEGVDALSVCQGGATHILHPFGSSPTIVTLTVMGQPACLVMPSADAPSDQGHPPAELGVLYPRSVGSMGVHYPVFILYADADHIRGLASTIRFLEPTNGYSTATAGAG